MNARTLDLAATRDLPVDAGSEASLWSLTGALLRGMWDSISQAHLSLVVSDRELRLLSGELSEAGNGHAGDVSGATRRYLRSVVR